jgi:hypothetical protein
VTAAPSASSIGAPNVTILSADTTAALPSSQIRTNPNRHGLPLYPSLGVSNRELWPVPETGKLLSQLETFVYIPPSSEVYGNFVSVNRAHIHAKTPLPLAFVQRVPRELSAPGGTERSLSTPRCFVGNPTRSHACSPCKAGWVLAKKGRRKPNHALPTDRKFVS